MACCRIRLAQADPSPRVIQRTAAAPTTVRPKPHARAASHHFTATLLEKEGGVSVHGSDAVLHTLSASPIAMPIPRPGSNFAPLYHQGASL
jgi:hypothetical protein